MIDILRKWLDRALVAFDVWFCSKAGVYHTLLIVLGIVVIERLCPHLDPSMFALMAWLTVYSAVTQPALAQTGAESAKRIEALHREHAKMLAAVRDLAAKQNEMLAAIHSTVAHEEAELAQIEQDLRVGAAHYEQLSVADPRSEA